ncbi:MAG: AbrB/MazE/SpoVT family DNA-binding domain-containing protein [Planctomycetes bacterium]|nr:AbrB/MazE/SpoVT family DNA-binding domain-containing protein [Planctomycetota bacterium]
MEIQFAKWGNSVALRVPSKVAEALGIVPGSMASLDLKRDKLIITPQRHRYQLDQLLSEITSKNLHQETGTGSAVGAEACD